MSKTTLTDLKSRFETGDKPTGADFVDLIDTLEDGSTLLVEVTARINADTALQESINNISLTPGPQGPQGVQGSTGTAGAQGAQGATGASTTIQSLGTKNTDYTVNFNNGRFVVVSTGSGNAIITIPDWESSTESVTAWLYIAQGSTARTHSIGAAAGTNNNVVSSGGVLSAGKSFPNSGANTKDAFEFTWNGVQWIFSNALYDIKA